MKAYYKTDVCALYQCDNLDLMKLLPNSYIDLIYCDILYNTGRKFVDYDDRLGTPKEAVRWYEPRLCEMYRILKDTGSIYLQMDYRLVHYLKVKMDEIFGSDNFINEIIWSYKNGGSSTKYFSRKHDNILFYSKTKKYYYNNIKEKSYVNKTKGYNPYTQQFKDEKGVYVLTNPIDVWEISCITAHDKTNRNGYSTQKPKELLAKIINASSSENNIVADFFMGSGTTGEVALTLGRKFIGCDIGDNACNISQERLSRIE
jgi:DNA modification methylase